MSTLLFINASTFTKEGLLELLISFSILAFSLSVHECAHGWAAHKLGDDTALEAGRLTLNPLAHLDPLGTIMMLSGIIGWAKPVPINPNRFDRKHSRKKGIVLTAAAGPISNLLLSFIAYFLLNLMLYGLLILRQKTGNSSWIEGPIPQTLLLILQRMAILNVYLAVFNSLPVPPLDGYKVFGAILPNETYYRIMRVERQIGLVVILIIVFAPSLLSKVMGRVAGPIFSLLTFPVDQLFRLLSRLLG